MARQIEMLWDCSSCGVRNRGRDSVCTSCGNPKDPGERWVMPGDPKSAPTVTDPSLLKKALAGPHWTCGACGSQVPAAESTCTQCSAPRSMAVVAPMPPPAPLPPGPSWTAPTDAIGKLFFRVLVLVPLVWSCFCCGLLGSLAPKPRDVDAVATSHHWSVAVDVERYALRPEEGFSEAVPKGATDIQKAGRRHHHDKEIPDGSHIEHYEEEVSDGTRTEHYTVEVRCGQDCTTTPRECEEVCTPNDNGFATCRDHCTGGERECTTRWCDEDRTRQVPKTKMVTRSRRVQDYRYEPVDATWFTWKAWSWAPERTVSAEGTTDVVAWPSTDPPAPLAKGEQERFTRRGTFDVVLTTAEDKPVPLHMEDEVEFLMFPEGSHHRVHVDANGEHGKLLPPAAAPSP